MSLPSKMSSMFEKEMRHMVEFVPNRLYFVALSSTPPATSGRHFFCIDNEMVYWNFYLDFGPLNLGHLMRYVQLLNKKLSDPKLQDKIIIHYSSTSAPKRTNAAFLICAWNLLINKKTPDEAFFPFRNYVAPFPPWHDATQTTCSFNLTLLDTLKGLHKARELKFFDFENFNHEEYEHYEQVENGDLSWYLDGKFLAFAGPHAEREMGPGGYYTHRPEDYIPYFKRRNVSLVVRLNKPYYDARKFIQNGIDHMDLYFVDGSNPPENILQRFIAKCEETPGAVAVHCKAGLGRTGTCIAAYIMKHYRVTAEEIIGWMRITRPGSVIGPQQHYLKEIQQRMWREGELMRAKPSAGLSLPSVTDVSTARPSTGSSPASGRLALSARTSTNVTSTTTATTISFASPQGASNLLSRSAAVTASTSISPSTGSGRLSSAVNSPSMGLSRPSSRGPSRPSSSSGVSTERDESDKDNQTQGDLLRLRRQQNMSSLSPAGGSTPVKSPAAPTTPLSAASDQRSRSRLSGLLSPWNK